MKQLKKKVLFLKNNKSSNNKRLQECTSFQRNSPSRLEKKKNQLGSDSTLSHPQITAAYDNSHLEGPQNYWHWTALASGFTYPFSDKQHPLWTSEIPLWGYSWLILVGKVLLVQPLWWPRENDCFLHAEVLMKPQEMSLTPSPDTLRGMASEA